jgi:hypothetical protein
MQNARITANRDLYHELAKLPRNCSAVPDHYPLNALAFIELCKLLSSFLPRCAFWYLIFPATAGRNRATVDWLLQAYEVPIPTTDREAFVDLAAFLGINRGIVPGTRRGRGQEAPIVPI